MNLEEFEQIGEFLIGEQLIYFGARFGSNFTKVIAEHPDIKKEYEMYDYDAGISYPFKFKEILCDFYFDENNKYGWWRLTDTLGNIKGIVSTEDRQLLKIVHSLSDEDVDRMIAEYKEQYKLYLKNSKIYGKEKWR